MGEVGAVEEVAGLGVLRDHPQRLLLAATADEDRRVRALHGLRGVEGAAEPVVLAGIRLDAVAPHLEADLQRLLEALEALGGGREGQAETDALLLVPRGADAEHGAALRQHVEGRDLFGEQPRLPVDGGRDPREQVGPSR